MQMTLDLNGDGGRHKAQLETERDGRGALSVWRGGGGRRLNANLRKPVYGRIGTQSQKQAARFLNATAGRRLRPVRRFGGNNHVGKDPSWSTRVLWKPKQHKANIRDLGKVAEGNSHFVLPSPSVPSSSTHHPNRSPHRCPWRRHLKSELPLLVAAATGRRARVRERMLGRIINMHKLEEPGRGFNCVCRRVKLRLMEGIQNYRRRKGGSGISWVSGQRNNSGSFHRMISLMRQIFCCTQGMTNNLKTFPTHQSLIRWDEINCLCILLKDRPPIKHGLHFINSKADRQARHNA